MVEHILANHNAAMAATAVSLHSDEGTVMECEVSDKDLSGPAGE
jgi:hypothetical protein